MVAFKDSENDYVDDVLVLLEEVEILGRGLPLNPLVLLVPLFHLEESPELLARGHNGGDQPI